MATRFLGLGERSIQRWKSWLADPQDLLEATVAAWRTFSDGVQALLIPDVVEMDEVGRHPRGQAAAALGGAQTALDTALSYTGERQAFDPETLAAVEAYLHDPEGWVPA